MIGSQPRELKNNQHSAYSVPDTILNTLLNWFIDSSEQSYEVDAIIFTNQGTEALKGFVAITCSRS